MDIGDRSARSARFPPLTRGRRPRDAATTSPRAPRAMSQTTLDRSSERSSLLLDVERASTSAPDDVSEPRRPAFARLTPLIISVGATCFAACAIGASSLGKSHFSISNHALGAHRGWLNVERSAAVSGGDRRASALGVDNAAASADDGPATFARVPSAFDVEKWLNHPTPVVEAAMDGARMVLVDDANDANDVNERWTLEITDERDLWKIPVVKHGGGYRLGNIVKRRGEGWIDARIAAMNSPQTYDGSLVGTFLTTRAEGAREFAAIVAARARDREILKNSAIGPKLARSIVMPLRLSDKVGYIERNERLIVDAALDHRRSRCPTTCESFIVSVSLIWGDDKRGRFAFDNGEYEESIRVLRSMLAYAKQVFPSDFKLVVAVVDDADEAITALAYAPHLMSNPIDSASTLVEVVRSTHALIADDEESLLRLYDDRVAPRAADARASADELAALHHLATSLVALREVDLVPDWFNVIRAIEGWRDDVSILALASAPPTTLASVAQRIDAKRRRDASSSTSSVDAKHRPHVVVLAHDDDDG